MSSRRPSIDAPPVLFAPSFPRRSEARDGQSVYVVEAAHALAAVRGAPIRAFALRLGDEPEFERDGPLEIRRFEPSRPIASPFSLYEAAHFEATMRRFADEAARHAPPGAPALLHGYELGPAARRLAARGHRVVAVLHYLLAQESERYLAGARDEFRAAVMPGGLTLLGRHLPQALRPTFVRTTSRLAGPATAWPAPWPPLIRHQLRKLSLERALVRAADLVVGVSAGFAGEIRRYYPFARVASCHAGHPEDVAAAAWSPNPEGRLRLLAVGRPTPQKGWDTLAAALGILERDHPSLASRLELSLVGGAQAWAGPHSEFGTRMRARFEALRRVRWHDLGHLSRREVLSHYGSADVFVLPSDYEPFGLVLLEAMAAGCPVLAFATDGPRDLLTTDAGGWCLPLPPWPRRAETLARSIASLFDLGEDDWRTRRAAARARAEQLTWRGCAEAHDRFLRGDDES